MTEFPTPPEEVHEWERRVTHRCPNMTSHHRRDNLHVPIPCAACYSVESLWHRIPWKPNSRAPINDPLRLADAYTVAVEVAKRLDGGWVPRIDALEWRWLQITGEGEPMPPAHADFLRSIREDQ